MPNISTPSTRSFLNWNTFFDHFQKDIKLVLLCMFSLTAFRTFLTVQFFDRLSDDVGLYDIFLTFANGLRFDLSIGGYAALPSFLLGIFSGISGLDRVAGQCRRFLAIFFLTVSAAVFVVNYLFIREFNDNFNQWVFGAVYDDFFAVIKSMNKEHPLFVWFFIAFASLAGLSWAGIKFLSRPFVSKKTIQTRFPTPIAKTLITAALLIVFVVFIRGSVGTRPVQLKDAGVTRDEFLNKLIVNPYYAFKYALQQHRKLTHAKGIRHYLPDGNIRGAAKLFFNTHLDLPSLDEYMKKTAKGCPGSRPRHIFFIVMESLDSWSLLEKYRSFDLLPNLKQLGNRGLLITSFLPASSGTMTSLAAIVTGLADAGVFTNYQPSALKPFPTSVAPQFKALGYTTNLFYGGYLSWQKIGDFCKAQGFDQIYGGGQMGPWQNREWGVGDDILFKFILEKLNDAEPSFNLILTTSYHSPYDLPVVEEGFPYRNMPKELESLYDGDVPLTVFGHLWYTDKLLGRFVEGIENKLPGSLFAVTGDHWSRKYLNQKPSLYERSSVPLLLYGKDTLPKALLPVKMAGSHIDIAPTLIELAAPAGFEYHSMGENLLNTDHSPAGFGVAWAITPDFILDLNNNFEKLAGPNLAVSEKHIEKLASLHRAAQGLAWWRIMKGAKFD
jgi:phosphoglycerol transferase MdoB-like AlkP superfamily enzyme